MYAQLAFLGGLGLNLALKNPRWQDKSKSLVNFTLQTSIVFQGATLNFGNVLQTGYRGLIVTLISIVLIFLAGMILKKFLEVPEDESLLLSMGTAICGGSAISALAPVISAGPHAMGLAFGIVFLLNIVALFTFPYIGDFFQLSQEQFGTWAALAIHDTSSVTATAATYGTEALKVATTLKLTRALWIIPVTLFFAVKRKKNKSALKIPYFIGGFVLASLLFTYVQLLHPYAYVGGMVSKFGFTVTLFLIGFSFNLKNLREMAKRPLVYGLILWLVVAATSLVFVMA